MMEFLTHDSEHHEIGDGRRLVMMMATNPLSGAVNELQVSPPNEEQQAAAPFRKTR